MNTLKKYLILSYILGLIFFVVHDFSFEFFLLIDPITFIVLLNVPSILIGLIFYVFKKNLFWIFYGITFFLLSMVFIFWSIIEIYTGGDWGKIL